MNYQSNINWRQSYELIKALKKFDGAIDYDGSCSNQVLFHLSNGKTLRFMVVDSDVGDSHLAVDQYPGLAIVDSAGETKFV